MKLFKLLPFAVSARQLNTTTNSTWTKTTYVPANVTVNATVNATTNSTTLSESEDFVNPCSFRIEDDFYQLS